MINLKRKLVTASLVVTAGLGTLAAPMAAHASEAGRRNTTLALGALTAVLAAKGQWVPAAIAGAGTVVAQQKWQGDINKRHQQQDWYSNRYGGQNYQNNGWSQQNWNQSSYRPYAQDQYRQNQYQQNQYQQNRYGQNQNRNDQGRRNGNKDNQNRQDQNRQDRNHNGH